MKKDAMRIGGIFIFFPKFEESKNCPKSRWSGASSQQRRELGCKKSQGRSGRTVINGPWTLAKRRDRELMVHSSRQVVLRRRRQGPGVLEGDRGFSGRQRCSQAERCLNRGQAGSSPHNIPNPFEPARCPSTRKHRTTKVKRAGVTPQEQRDHRRSQQ